MKRIVSMAVAALFVGSFAMANTEAENSEKATTDKSHNPITGSDTVTKKYNKKVKDPAGNSANMEVTEKTKTYKDGTKKKDVEVEAKEKSGHH